MADNHLAMVTEWMVNGNVNEFVKANKDADRSGLVRFHFRSHGILLLVNNRLDSYSWEMLVWGWNIYTARRWFTGT